MTERYRLIQNGTPVAWTEGETARAEIDHYALVYGQDGPVTIQILVKNSFGNRWKDVGSG